MKLAEALMERKDTKARMEALKKRLYANAKTEEGGAPAEPPGDLLLELLREVEAFEQIVSRINRTNAAAQFADGTSLVLTLIQKDMLRYRHLVLTNLADHAVAAPGRYSARELRSVPAVDVSEARRAADRFAREGRLLDAQIQRLNWATELLP
jgi:hypothetical protein